MIFTTDLQATIAAAAAHDTEQFRALYEHLVDRVYAYVRFRCSDEEVATDLVQEIFIDLYRSLPTFTYRSDAQFYGFVFTITKRKLAKHYDLIRRHPLSEALDETVVADDHAPDLATTDAVARALTQLDEVTREIVILRHWSRYSFAEIATLIASTESAVRTRHHRALQTLATHMGEHS